MATAKSIQVQATSAKRASTAINNIVKQIQLQQRYDDKSQLINGAEQEILMKAATILTRVGKHVADTARKLKSDEDQFERDLAKATNEAKQIIATWPAQTILEKVAIILGSDCAGAFRKEVDASYLDYWYQEALRDIPSRAAWLACSKKCSVATLMAGAAEKLQGIRDSSEAQLLARRWEEKLGRNIADGH